MGVPVERGETLVAGEGIVTEAKPYLVKTVFVTSDFSFHLIVEPVPTVNVCIGVAVTVNIARIGTVSVQIRTTVGVDKVNILDLKI